MSTGHIIVIVGACLAAAGVLLFTLGGVIAGLAKKNVLKKIKREYR